MEHAQVLELASGFPLKVARPGEIIIEQEGDAAELLVLQSGTVEVRRDGQLVAVIDEAGATLGEISMLLDSPSTADVVARGRVELRVIADPDAFFADHPALALFIARQLAERLARVTSYLADLKDEFGEADGHMGLVPQIVSELLAWRRLTSQAAADLVQGADQPATEDPEAAAETEYAESPPAG